MEIQMPVYKLCGMLAHPSKKYDFTLVDIAKKIDVADTIREAAKHFTDEGKTAKNVKSLEITKITEKEIYCTLTSAQELPTPSRALRVFSQKLSESPYFSDKKYNHGLLKFCVQDNRVQSIKDGDNELSEMEAAIIHPDKISDEEFITALMKYFLSEKGAYTPELYQKKKAIEQMKILAYQAKIVEIENERVNGEAYEE